MSEEVVLHERGGEPVTVRVEWDSPGAPVATVYYASGNRRRMTRSYLESVTV